VDARPISSAIFQDAKAVCLDLNLMEPFALRTHANNITPTIPVNIVSKDII
jgi:hypothetical protein